MRLFRGLFAPADPMNALARQTGVVELPFEIRPVESDHELVQVAALRSAGYKLGAQNPVTTSISSVDYAPNTVVLGAFDKESAVLLGTMRIVAGSLGPTEIEQLVSLPGRWGHGSLGEARLLCVPKSDHAVGVKIMMCKVFYQIALRHNIDNLVIASRRALEGFYRLMHFTDLQPDGVRFKPPGSAITHSVLGLRTDEVETRWKADAEMHAFVRIFFEQTHPDLKPFYSQSVFNPLYGTRAITDLVTQRGEIKVAGASR